VAAIKACNEAHGTAIIIHQVKSLYHSVGQDHRGMKRIMRRVLGCKSFEAARSILVAIALMHVLKTGQRVTIEGAEGPPPTESFSVLAV